MDNLSLEEELDHLEKASLQKEQEISLSAANVKALRKLKRRIRDRRNRRKKKRASKMPSSTKKERTNGKGFVFAEKFGADGAAAQGQGQVVQKQGESSVSSLLS